MDTAILIETVNRARLGDSDALQTLYLDIYRSVYFLTLRFVKNPEDAEDITQEVYITVQQKIPELRQPIAFYGWVNQITVNKCNRFMSRQKGISWIDDEEEFLSIVDDDPANLPDKALDDEATRKIILEVIDKLPDGQRACVLLYYYAQNTIAQIADMLETNENTVKSRLALARAKIRAALEEKEKKEGIKLWGIPLALTPILRQDHDNFVMPQGAEARIIDFISKATAEHISEDSSLDAEQPGNPEAVFEQASISGVTSGAANNAVRVVANAFVRKMIIALLCIAGATTAITTAIVVVPMITDNSNSPPPTVVTDTATTDTKQGDSGDMIEETPDGIDTSGGIYEGEYDADGKRSGWGEWVYHNFRYIGYWENDMPNGEGTLYRAYQAPENPEPGSYPVMIVVTGSWINGFADGEISLDWHMDFGTVLTWHFNIENGYTTQDEVVIAENGVSDHTLKAGVLIAGVPPWADVVIDSTIDAPWYDSKGISGGIYEGEYDADGKRSGWGEWVYHNFRYIGYWENDMPNGEGTLYEAKVRPEDADPSKIYGLKIIVKGFWIDGFADGEASLTWYMENSEVHTWQIILSNGYSIEDDIISEINGGPTLTVRAGSMQGSVPPWSDVTVNTSIDAPTPD